MDVRLINQLITPLSLLHFCHGNHLLAVRGANPHRTYQPRGVPRRDLLSSPPPPLRNDGNANYHTAALNHRTFYLILTLGAVIIECLGNHAPRGSKG